MCESILIYFGARKYKTEIFLEAKPLSEGVLEPPKLLPRNATGKHVYLENSLGHLSILLFLYFSNLHTTMHGGETWYACVFRYFHDYHEPENSLSTTE